MCSKSEYHIKVHHNITLQTTTRCKKNNLYHNKLLHCVHNCFIFTVTPIYLFIMTMTCLHLLSRNAFFLSKTKQNKVCSHMFHLHLHKMLSGFSFITFIQHKRTSKECTNKTVLLLRCSFLVTTFFETL